MGVLASCRGSATRPTVSARLAGTTAFLVLLTLSASAAVLPALPQRYLDTTPQPSLGKSIYVPAGGDLQTALNAAQPGDQILLAAGATFTGTFTLPPKPGNSWITIRSSISDASLPAYGARIMPAWSSVMPKIVSMGSEPALRTAPGAHHYRVIGVEFSVAATVAVNYGIITVGDGSPAQNTLSNIPYAIVFDRVYVHGTPTGNTRRGFGLNSAQTAIVNSYISEIHASGFDAQAIAGWNGPGPFKIQNNYLEASGENVLFGGADPAIPNLVPSDIEIRGNYLVKPLTWRQGSPTFGGIPWTVKNLFELKNAQRVLVDGNLMENNWGQAQNGFSVLFTVRNQGGTAPWSIVADVTFTHNIVRHVASGINILGHDDIHPSQQLNRVLVRDNLFDDVNGAAWGGAGRLIQVLSASANVTVDHNTALQTGDFIAASPQPHTGFSFTNNIVPNNQYGLGGDSCYGQPLMCITMYFPGALVTRNVIAGGTPALYPAGNFFPTTLAGVMFVSLSGRNYQLSAASPYMSASTDGTAIGVDWLALAAATAGTVVGTDSVPPSARSLPPVARKGASGRLPSPVGSDPPNVAGSSGPTAPLVFTVSNIRPFGAARRDGGNLTMTIGWVTNLRADSQIQYGRTTAYDAASPLDPTLVTRHTAALAGLKPSTTYHYRVLSRDRGGNLASSRDFTFTTPAGARGSRRQPRELDVASQRHRE